MSAVQCDWAADITTVYDLLMNNALPGITPEMRALADALCARAPYDGRFELPLPGVQAYRASRTTPELFPVVQQSALCIIAQGSKRTLIGQDVFEYDESRMLVASLDVPMAAQITRASTASPYLSLKLDLDPLRIADLTLKVYPNGLPRAQDPRAIYVGRMDRDIVLAATRLLSLLDHPGDVELIGPLVVDEIIIRLLRGPIGPRVALMGQADSTVRRIGKVIAHIRDHYMQALQAETLAGLASMSVSSFHQHFKSVTSMSPLQYQKALRLQEARRLMLGSLADAASAARRVGYVSASQFSREYTRFFGMPPSRDMVRLRDASGDFTDEERSRTSVSEAAE